MAVMIRRLAIRRYGDQPVNPNTSKCSLVSHVFSCKITCNIAVTKYAKSREEHWTMKRLLMTFLIGFAFVSSAYPAMAGDKYYKGHSYGHHSYGGHYKAYRGHRYKHGYRHHYGDEILMGAGIIGGSILLGSLLSQPNYYPSPTYYAPARGPVCQQDQVYRYLPDGRVQWGTRTRCY